MASQATSCTHSTDNMINKLKFEKIKLIKTNLNIEFNRLCKIHRVIPRYIHVPIMTNTDVAIKTKAYAECYWLNNEIRYQYKQKNIILKNLDKIKQNFESLEYYDIIEKMRSEISTICLLYTSRCV